jgi:hypothetical protein
MMLSPRFTRLALRAPVRLAARAMPLMQARGVSALARALVRAPMALPRSVPQHASGVRGLCGVTIDKTCRVYTCKVADDAMAHQLDLLMDEFIEQVETLDGYAGATRLICKSEWDYKLIIKFGNLDALKEFMASTHPALQAEFKPRMEELISGKVHEQNFGASASRAQRRASDRRQPCYPSASAV